MTIKLSIQNLNILIILIALIGLSESTEPYKKIIHNIDESAKCLDGSPAALY